MANQTGRAAAAVHEANKAKEKEKEVQEMNNTAEEETMENEPTEEMTFEDTVAQLRAQQLALIAQIEQVKLSKLDVWKLKHPKASKRLSKIGLGVGLVGAWMLGGAVQERRDAKTVQKAIDDGTLVRAKDLEPIDVDAVEVDETTVG